MFKTVCDFEFWPLRFICDLVLGIWDLINFPPQQDLKTTS
jgi:hypothetical protein